MKTVNSDPHYITALVLEYLEKGHELLVECKDGRKVTFDPYVCAVVPHNQTVALVGHYVKILEPFYTEKGCLLCSDMEVIAKEDTKRIKHISASLEKMVNELEERATHAKR